MIFHARSKQFLFAGMTSSLLLGILTFFISRPEFPPDINTLACLLDIAFQIAFGFAALWTVRTTGLASQLEPFIDYGTPSLKTLSALTPWLVLLQIAMGAALRYKLMGAMSHVLGAMLVGAFLLYFATGILTPTQPGHPARTAALSLLWLVLLQILLGIAAYVVRFSGPDSGIPNTRLFLVLHIYTALFLLANSWVLAHFIPHCAISQEAPGTSSPGSV